MRKTAKVKWFDNGLGYGFIETDVGEVLLHHSEIQMDGFKTVRRGTQVEYTPVNGDRGLRAVDVVVLGKRSVN